MYIRAHRNPPSDVYSLNGGSTYPISNLYMYLRMYDFVMFTCIGYKLPTFWEWMSIGEDSVRPSGAGLRNVHFLIMTHFKLEVMIHCKGVRGGGW